MSDETDVGPLISDGDRDRVKGWVDEAVAAGGELLAGGELVDEGRCLAPTVLAIPRATRRSGARRSSDRWRRSHTFKSFDEGLEMANDAKFGLQAGVFTRDIGRAIEAGNRLEFGGVLINEVPTFRTDQMPYGGVKDSATPARARRTRCGS